MPRPEGGILSREGCRSRIDRFRAGLDASVDAAVITRPEHLLYLANFFPLPNSLNLHGGGVLVIERDGPVTLFTDNWLGGDMAPAPDDVSPVDRVVKKTWYDCSGPAVPRIGLVADTVREFLAARGIRSIATETAYLPARIASVASTIVDCEPRLLSMREVKDDDELDAIRRGVRTAEAVHRASRELLRPGLTELAYYAALVEAATIAAECPFVMMCDLASGDAAARGGGAPRADKILEAGELVIHDIFPYVEGYRGDITNTLVVGGEPTSEQSALFELVRSGLEQAEALLRPGSSVAEITRAVVTRFESAGETLPHHAGHAIGLGHPEAPEIVLNSDRTLEAGMVLTLEPGIYGKPDAPIRGGIRLEHDYLITSDGFERLSNHELSLS